MIELSADSPFKLLQEYERRILERNVSLPSREARRDQWVGIAFHIGDNAAVASMDDVAEILEPPPITRVPGTKPWFLGIANVRGNLIPITDLHCFVFGEPLSPTQASRVLMFNKRGVAVGIRVQDVLGLKHFDMEECVDSSLPLSERITPFIHSTFKRLDEAWAVFNLREFVTSETFIQVAE